MLFVYIYLFSTVQNIVLNFEIREREAPHCDLHFHRVLDCDLLARHFDRTQTSSLREKGAL
jgi:hypothetical protein